jgi:hypothetical protein
MNGHEKTKRFRKRSVAAAGKSAGIFKISRFANHASL